MLPLGKVNGKNVWTITGWEVKYSPEGDEKFVLKSDDGRKSDEMGANKLLEALADFESANPSILFKRADGGYNYTKKVVVEFSYTDKRGGFKTPYSDIKIYIQGATPPKA